MKKIAGSTLVILALFPLLALASGPSGALSFAPPPSDLSVVFLGNIFGVVDGVLHGTGSQIMGNMFGIFNAAVLALGGMVIMYTLMVSTMNTAHEGEVLGKKWSEIWIPVRSSLGLALLVPKASGYCVMQIFFMWIVVQGVGAADKIWGSALSYLNRGGVIVQAAINPTAALLGGDGSVTSGASIILSGQACMLGLEKSLVNNRNGLLNAKNEGESGDCYNPSDSMKAYCTTPVPSFLDSVNAVTFQTNNPTASSYTLPMPNFGPDSAPYNSLNGVCGSINWNNMDLNSSSSSLNNINTLTDSEKQTANMSRAIAIQQMYTDLGLVAQKMIANDYQFSATGQQPTFGDSNKTPPLFAFYQYGVPFMSSGAACKETDPDCTNWSGEPSASGNLPAIFNGTEFQGAIADYNAVMLPTLTLINESQNSDTANQLRAFITKANAEGWMLAGSYFFNLVNINAASSVTYNGSTTSYTDQNTGLDETNGFSLTQSIDTNLTCPTQGQPTDANKNLCSWLANGVAGKTRAALQGLMNNSSNFSPTIPSQTNPGKLPAQPEPLASTVYGFVNNSLVIQLPGQPGLAPYQFQVGAMPKVVVEGLSLPKIDFDCGTLKTLVFFVMCIAKVIGQMLYNQILSVLFNWLLGLMLYLANKLLMLFLFLPLKGIAYVFSQGIAYIQMPGINPVLGMAAMGTWFINFANAIWMMLLEVGVLASVMPFGIGDLVMIPMMIFIFPILCTWLGIMIGIGFITAYYMPFLPYMIFTFGSIAWLMAVIEAMVAAPIVALGVTNPEGEGLFGKGEHAILILMNVFLRPSLMILGYIAGIILSFVAVWVINAGFSNVVTFILGSSSGGVSPSSATYSGSMNTYNAMASNNTSAQISSAAGYTGWAGIYGFFFSMVIYVSMYIVVVQKAFSLIVVLPDKVLTWIGGQNAGIGEQSAAWGDETKSKISEGGKETYNATQQTNKALKAKAEELLAKGKGGGPDVSG